MDPGWRTHELTVGDDPTELIHREWLLTNGTGAFAMGTAAGIHTRRYHGLLVAATRPPVGRIIALNQVLEQLVIQTPHAEKKLDFSACMFREADGSNLIAPQGHTKLRRFERGLSVAWHYIGNDVEFSRELFLHWKQQVATLTYVVRGLHNGGKLDKAVLRLTPMITLRDFHGVLHQDTATPFNVTKNISEDQVAISQGDARVVLTCKGTCFREDPQWWNNLHYPRETDRGLEDSEDNFLPGAFELNLTEDDEQTITLTAALGDEVAHDDACDSKGRQIHLSAHLTHVEGNGETIRQFNRHLTIAADDFVVDRTVAGKRLVTILAGYPWFSDWGRDTFIALPGLLLCTGRFEEAKSTLHAFAETIRHGLIPNRFDDYEESMAHYNTVDASLWFIHAAIQYVVKCRDYASWNEWLCDACRKVIDGYLKGTDFDIKMTGDGLIYAGSPKTQLTWMDAAHGKTIFTPRPGKAVEINALWYNALRGMGELLNESDPHIAEHYRKLGDRIERAFIKTFWNADQNCLHDHVWIDGQGNEHVDVSIRPNQIFAASLPHSPLPMTKQKLLVNVVGNELATPFGLRTLPSHDPNYHGRYEGSPFHRDKAYHQGTVWSWLIGPYAEALLRIGKFSNLAKADAMAAISPLLESLVGKSPWPTLGQVHEIHESDPPHCPVGCIAQAWSVAELIRVLHLIDTH